VAFPDTNGTAAAAGRPASFRGLRCQAADRPPRGRGPPVRRGRGGLAAGTPALDRWLGPDRTPSWLHVGTSVAQALTTGFGTSLLFLISVAFRVWMWPAQMSAEPLSTRQQLARRKSLFGQPSREPPALVKPTA
jgi:hypothetical protein